MARGLQIYSVVGSASSGAAYSCGSQIVGNDVGKHGTRVFGISPPQAADDAEFGTHHENDNGDNSETIVSRMLFKMGRE